jgi:hypothetical protein
VGSNARHLLGCERRKDTIGIRDGGGQRRRRGIESVPWANQSQRVNASAHDRRP